MLTILVVLRIPRIVVILQQPTLPQTLILLHNMLHFPLLQRRAHLILHFYHLVGDLLMDGHLMGDPAPLPNDPVPFLHELFYQFGLELWDLVELVDEDDVHCFADGEVFRQEL